MPESARKPESVLRRLPDLLLGAVTYLLAGLLVRVFWLFESSVDMRAYGTERLRLLKRAGERPLVVLWHGKGFVPIAYFHGERLCLYASHTRDPDYGGLPLFLRWLTLRLIERMGYRVLDASGFSSESRGVLTYLHELKAGAGGAIAADGPGGPIYQAKPGACFLAKKAGVTLLPVGAAISAGYRLDQWDHFEVPRPFCRAVILVEEAIHISAKATDSEMEQARLEMERALNRATHGAEERLARWQHPLATGDARAAPPQSPAQPAPP